jgi:TP901 family phage tail tape measure protein
VPVTVSELQVRVSADTSPAEKELDTLGSKVGGLGSTLAGIGAGAAVAGIAALGAAFVGSVGAASSFATELSAISAVSGATADEMSGLSGLALQLGKDTSFSASEAAKGIEELVKAGVSIPDIMGGAASASLSLAAAGAVSVGDAAAIAATAMNTFSLKGSDLAHVADVIAGAANASAIDVNDYKFSLSAAGAVAATVGIGFDDLSTAIAVMGQAGIKGSDAGTSLKTMMLNLAPSTDKAAGVMKQLGIITADGANQFFTAEGKAKSLADVSGVLQNATKDLTDQQKLAALQTMFGTDAVRAAAIMAKAGAEGFNDMAASMGKVTAAAVAQERLNNLAGSWQQLTGSVETLAITFGTTFLPVLKKATDGLTGLVNSAIPVVERWAPSIEGAVDGVSTVFDAVFAGDLPDLIPLLNHSLDGIGGAITTAVEGWATDFAAWVDSASPDLLSNLGDMALSIQAWVFDTSLAIIEQLGTWAAAFIDWVGPKIPVLIRELGAFLAKMLEWAGGTALPTLAEKLLEWGTAFVEWIAPKIVPMLLELGKLELELLGWIFGTALPAIVSKLLEWGAAFVDWVGPKIGPLLLELGKLSLEVLGWMANTALPAIIVKLAEWGAAFLDWVAKDVLPDLPGRLGFIIESITTWVSTHVDLVAANVKSIGSAILQGIQDGISGALGGFWSWLQTNFVDKIPEVVRNILNIHSPSGVFVDIGRNMVEGLRVGMEQRLPSVQDLISRTLGSVGGSMGGNVDDWLKAAISATGVSGDWLPGLRWIVEHESGGDPHAKNPHSTASGLFQMIDTTWAGARDKSLPNDIWNPIINAIAGIRYIAERYGNANNAVDFWQAHGHYAQGGWAGLHGPELAWLGEKGPEYVVPNAALPGGGGRGQMQRLQIDVTADGRTKERLWIEGYQLLARRGGLPGRFGDFA